MFRHRLRSCPPCFQKRKRGKAIGVIVASVYLGLSAGPTLAGLMISHLGWQYIFFIAVPLSLLALILTVLRLKGDWRGAENDSFDAIGSIIYMVSLFCLIVGVSHLKEGTWAIALMAVGMVGLARLFCFRIQPPLSHSGFSPALGQPHPGPSATLPPGSITRHRLVSPFSFPCTCKWSRDYPRKPRGLILIVQPLIQAGLSPIAGMLSDRHSPSKLATAGMAICAVGLGLAAFIGQNTSIPHIVMVLVVMGLGFAIFSSPNMTTIMGSVEPTHYGIASSLVATMRSVGMLSAMTIITVLLGMFMGDAGVSAETIPGFLQTMHTGFIAFSLLSFVGIGFSMVRVS